MGSETYHEPLELLSEETKNMHRAIVSLKEELEAVDWYQQRAEACSDEELRGVLVHNKNEEIEHAMMNLEWIRRHSKVFDANIKRYVGSKVPILEAEAEQTAAESGGAAAAKGKTAGGSGAGLGIGSLKEAK
jgi:ferritin-like protein